MAIDLARVRADTPGVANVLHFNNAGAALPPRPVTEAVIAHLTREAEIGGYEASEEAEPALEHCYDAIAQLLNCRRDEIAMFSSMLRPWTMPSNLRSSGHSTMPARIDCGGLSAGTFAPSITTVPW